jgi:Zn-finger nucleic acid-binding protein
MSAEAGSLSCPRCGAPAAPDAPRCAHCATALALVACPSCFGRIFLGARFCSHCGAAADREEPEAERAPRHCPRCRAAMRPLRIGPAALDECGGCGGLWASRAVLERVLADRESQAALLGPPTAAVPADTGLAAAPAAQGYVPCPDCARLMNRFNFARCSGVLVDVCRQHGTWFDRDELQRLVRFVREGGLERSRAKEREQLAEERRRLREQELQLAARQRSGIGGSPGVGSSSPSSSTGLDAFDVVDVVAVAGGALFELFGD